IELTNLGQLPTLAVVHAVRLQTDYKDLDISALAPAWLAKLPRKADTTAYPKTPVYLSVQSDQLLTPQSVQDIETGTLKGYFAAEVAYSDQDGARAPLELCGQYFVVGQRFTADCKR